MRNYIFKKFIIVLFLLLAADSLLFIMVRIVPGDPAFILAGNKTNSDHILEIREKLDLNRTIIEQYGVFIKNSINFDFGKSFIYNEKVSKIIFQSFPNTLYLSIAAMSLAILISFPLGIISSLKPNSGIDFFTTIISSSFLAIPNFLLGPVLILIFSVYFKLLPISGSDSLKHIVLPALTIGLSMTAFLTKIIRAAFYAEMNKSYVLFARAKGLNTNKIVFKHILKNAMIPILTVIGLQFGALISGVIITETIFSWQGIGTVLIEAIRFRDYPLISGLVLFILFLYLIIHFLVDLAYLFLDPKIRKKGLYE